MSKVKRRFPGMINNVWLYPLFLTASCKLKNHFNHIDPPKIPVTFTK